MSIKDFKVWEMYFDYLARKWSSEYALEFVEYYFADDDFAIGWFKSFLGFRVN